MGRRGWMGVDGGPIGGSISPPPSAFSRGAHRPIGTMADDSRCSFEAPAFNLNPARQ